MQKSNKENRPLIHHEDKLPWYEKIGGVILGSLFVGTPVLIITEITILTFFAYILGAILSLIILRIGKNSFTIYDDRIELFSKFFSEKREVISIENIEQVRYEDEFGDGYETKSWQIYLYFKEGHGEKSKRIKKNRLILFINKHKRKESIIQILRFFQEKRTEIYVLTKYKEINKALGLRNWNNPA